MFFLCLLFFSFLWCFALYFGVSSFECVCLFHFMLWILCIFNVKTSISYWFLKILSLCLWIFFYKFGTIINEYMYWICHGSYLLDSPPYLPWILQCHVFYPFIAVPQTGCSSDGSSSLLSVFPTAVSYKLFNFSTKLIISKLSMGAGKEYF